MVKTSKPPRVLGAYRPRSTAKKQPRIPIRFESPAQLALIKTAKARLNPEPTLSRFILEAAVERANHLNAADIETAVLG